MRHEENGRPFERDRAGESLAHGLGEVGVERGERLVEEEQHRTVGERASQRDALSLAARDLVRRPPREQARQAELAGELLDPAPPLLPADLRTSRPKERFSSTVRCGNSA